MAILAVLGVLGAGMPRANATPTIDQRFAVLQALDKITARVMRLEVEVGHTVPFGTLAITVDACRIAPPEETPENAAFVVAVDQPPNGEPRTVFSGWMFSSSPALSAMDHPVYDIWVVRCASRATPVATGEAGGAEPPPEAEPTDAAPPERPPLPEAPPRPPPLPAGRRTE